MEQHIAFSKSYKVLQDHMEESVIIEEVLRDCVLWASLSAHHIDPTRYPST